MQFYFYDVRSDKFVVLRSWDLAEVLLITLVPVNFLGVDSNAENYYSCQRRDLDAAMKMLLSNGVPKEAIRIFGETGSAAKPKTAFERFAEGLVDVVKEMKTTQERINQSLSRVGQTAVWTTSPTPYATTTGTVGTSFPTYPHTYPNSYQPVVPGVTTTTTIPPEFYQQMQYWNNSSMPNNSLGAFYQSPPSEASASSEIASEPSEPIDEDFEDR